MGASLDGMRDEAVTFGEMAREVPALAQAARTRFAATGLCLVGTVRSDGWPRISPVEPLLMEDQLYLGMMPRSTKSYDLGRNPRCLVHSTIVDKRPSGWVLATAYAWAFGGRRPAQRAGSPSQQHNRNAR